MLILLKNKFSVYWVCGQKKVYDYTYLYYFFMFLPEQIKETVVFYIKGQVINFYYLLFLQMNLLYSVCLD